MNTSLTVGRTSTTVSASKTRRGRENPIPFMRGDEPEKVIW